MIDSAMVKARDLLDQCEPHRIHDFESRDQAVRLKQAVEAVYSVFEAMREASEKVIMFAPGDHPGGKVEVGKDPGSPIPGVHPPATTGQYL